MNFINKLGNQELRNNIFLLQLCYWTWKYLALPVFGIQVNILFYFKSLFPSGSSDSYK